MFCFFDNSTAKVRRLYDIANVLSSLNLIEQVNRSLGKLMRNYNFFNFDLCGLDIVIVTDLSYGALKFLILNEFCADPYCRYPETCI